MIAERMAWVILFLSFVAAATSQLVLKARFEALGLNSHPRVAWPDALHRILADPMVWVGGILVIVGAVGWYLALTRLPLSLMLPLSALITPLVAIGAHVILGEALSCSKLGAILVITLGVAWLGAQ